MRRYILVRLGEVVITLLVLSTVVFGGVHLTGDPLRTLGGDDPRITPAVLAQIKHTWGLDQPVYIQYLRYMQAVITSFDFGTSFSQARPVRQVVFERLPNTLQLAGAGILVAILIGIPLGVMAALWRNSSFDSVVRLCAAAARAAPGFWLASMMILVFAATLRWLPAYGAGTWQQLVLPALDVGIYVGAGLMRLTRASLLDVLESDYIRFARIKGLRERLVISKHGLRNALIPVMTFGGLSVAAALNGSIIAEVVFARPGLGSLMLEGVTARDVPLVVAATMLSAFTFVMTAFVVDILNAYMDPRLRYSS